MAESSELYTVERDVYDSLIGANPPLLHLLEGYVDAGQVTRQLAGRLLAGGDSELVATFDRDLLHDYRSRRPQMVFDTNSWVGMSEQDLTLRKVTDDAGAPFLLLSGPEPDMRWHAATAAVLGIAAELGVSQLVAAQGVPMGVPHTRPTLVTGHATDPELVTDNPVWIDRVTVPGSFAAVLEYTWGQQGGLARGFVAHVPHYLAAGSYAPAALAVLERIRDATGLALPPGELAAQALAVLAQLEEEMDTDSELRPLVAALEQQYDELKESGRAAVPSPEEIGAAVERFLAEQEGREEPGGERR